AREFGSSLVLRAGWMGAVPVVLAKDSGGRADWYALAPGRAPKNLTHALAAPPGPLAALSAATGVHVVLGAGFYTQGYQDAATLALPVEALADIVTAQVEEGAWG
ncbi:MAG: hypothetical protein H3C60_10655, partial [Sphingomonadaceae bacterium]|nr:hypothetical protein [Sphingomonadaceae bacterium]